jgi:hypothetical protein
MTAVTQPNSIERASSKRADAPRRPVRRVRVPLLIGALAATLLATVLVLYGLSAAADRTQVLRVTRDIQAGEPIPADALVPVGVAVDATNQLLPASAASDVAGKVATKALVRGDLLSATDAAEAPQPVDGERRVGAVLAPGRYPHDLRRGDLALATATDGQASTVSVRVLDVRAAREGIELVLAVPADAAAPTAQLAAQGRLAVIGESQP